MSDLSQPSLPGSQGNLPNPPPLPGYGVDGQLLHLPQCASVPGYDADGNRIEDNTAVLPPPLGYYVASLAHSFIKNNPDSHWDVDVYYSAAIRFVNKVIADNAAPECWDILEKIVNGL